MPRILANPLKQRFHLALVALEDLQERAVVVEQHSRNAERSIPLAGTEENAREHNLVKVLDCGTSVDELLRGHARVTAELERVLHAISGTVPALRSCALSPRTFGLTGACSSDRADVA